MLNNVYNRLNDMKELKIVRSLLTEMNEKIRYCHWKSNQHISDALFGVDDLDILIDRKQYGELQSILNTLDFKHFYTPSIRTYIGIEDYLGFDEDTGKIVHLHLHHQLTLGEKFLKGFHLPLEEAILSSRRWEESAQLYCSSYYHELFLLIVRAAMKLRKRDVLKKNVLGKSSRAEYDWLVKKCADFESLLFEDAFFNNQVKDAILKIYKSGFTYSSCNSLKHKLFRYYSFYTQGSLLANTLRRQYREVGRVISELEKRVFKPNYPFLRRRVATGGLSIAFVGMDGAGKSTTIKEVRSWLSKVMDVRYFYLGSGDGPVSLLRAPLRLVLNLAHKSGAIKRSSVEDGLKEKDKSKPGFTKRLWFYTLSLERIERLKAMRRCRNRGFVTIADRYPQSEIPGLCDGTRFDRFTGLTARTEQRAMEYAKYCSPDLILKMMVSPEVAILRKPGELTLETGKYLFEKVRKIKYSERSNVVEINADQPQDKVWLDVKKQIWKML